MQRNDLAARFLGIVWLLVTVGGCEQGSTASKTPDSQPPADLRVADAPVDELMTQMEETLAALAKSEESVANTAANQAAREAFRRNAFLVMMLANKILESPDLPQETIDNANVGKLHGLYVGARVLPSAFDGHFHQAVAEISQAAPDSKIAQAAAELSLMLAFERDRPEMFLDKLRRHSNEYPNSQVDIELGVQYAQKLDTGSNPEEVKKYYEELIAIHKDRPSFDPLMDRLRQQRDAQQASTAGNPKGKSNALAVNRPRISLPQRNKPQSAGNGAATPPAANNNAARKSLAAYGEGHAMLGKPMQVAGPTLSGRQVSSAHFRGNVVLIDFWATWCGPCVNELPTVLEAHKRYGRKGFVVVGVSLDTDPQKLQQFVQSTGLPWEQIFSANGPNPMAQKYGVRSIPATFLLDRSGTVVAYGLRGENLLEAVRVAVEQR